MHLGYTQGRAPPGRRLLWCMSPFVAPTAIVEVGTGTAGIVGTTHRGPFSALSHCAAGAFLIIRSVARSVRLQLITKIRHRPVRTYGEVYHSTLITEAVAASFSGCRPSTQGTA